MDIEMAASSCPSSSFKCPAGGQTRALFSGSCLREKTLSAPPGGCSVGPIGSDEGGGKKYSLS